MDRATATRMLVSRLSDDVVVVSNLGQATQDLQRASDRPLNCYTFGSMGQCSSIGLGIALARRDVRVVCLDGDGSLLMNLGSLCTIATLQPGNYALVIWDNEVHMTTGGQPTATAHRSSLAQMARGAGIEKVIEPRDEAELGPCLRPHPVRGRALRRSREDPGGPVGGGSLARRDRVRSAVPSGARRRARGSLSRRPELSRRPGRAGLRGAPSRAVAGAPGDERLLPRLLHRASEPRLGDPRGPRRARAERHRDWLDQRRRTHRPRRLSGRERPLRGPGRRAPPDRPGRRCLLRAELAGELRAAASGRSRFRGP